MYAIRSYYVRIRGREFPPVKKDIKYIEDATKTDERYEALSTSKELEKPIAPTKEEAVEIESNVSKDDLVK